jgi:hypothetical protein
LGVDVGLIAHPVPGKPKAAALCAAFIAGAPKSATGHVFYGVKDTNAHAWKKVLASGEPYYFIDNSYFDAVRVGSSSTEGGQFRVTRNAIQLQGARQRRSDGKRWAALGVEILPWEDRIRGYWLAIEQSDVFMKFSAHEPRWYFNTIRNLQATGEPVKVRPWNPDKTKIQKALHADLEGARAVVTHSSAAAITGAIAGVPFVVSPESAVYGMEPNERLHFMQVLADNQYTTEELRSGFAWAMIHETERSE